jgi:hypothetical protein
MVAKDEAHSISTNTLLSSEGKVVIPFLRSMHQLWKLRQVGALGIFSTSDTGKQTNRSTELSPDSGARLENPALI